MIVTCVPSAWLMLCCVDAVMSMTDASTMLRIVRVLASQHQRSPVHWVMVSVLGPLVAPGYHADGVTCQYLPAEAVLVLAVVAALPGCTACVVGGGGAGGAASCRYQLWAAWGATDLECPGHQARAALCHPGCDG